MQKKLDTFSAIAYTISGCLWVATSTVREGKAFPLVIAVVCFGLAAGYWHLVKKH